jgi:Helix-loop-helix DNA-binding domain
VYSSNTLASSSLPSPVLRKSSHKAAEQKRRDSLKTTFDDLRLLLPPIPLPSEDGFPDEPMLPGAMPPRGPPRGNADGPNRGISKLQLLRCGNEYIRLLNEKISRRDNEMALLRYEVRRLRGLIGEDVWREGAEDIDLERDVDQGELGPWRRGSSTYDGDDGDEDMAE